MHSETSSELLALHRYYIWANRMRTHFDAILSDKDLNDDSCLIEANLYMSYWYAGLFVVTEGWKEMGLVDTAIDKLLTSPNLDLLKRYRNGTFHFQREYNDRRFLDLMEHGADVTSWVRELNQGFGSYFLKSLKNAK